jgi:hypothetical protein
MVEATIAMMPDYDYHDVGHYYDLTRTTAQAAKAHDRDGYSADSGCDHADGCAGCTTPTRSRPHATATAAKTATGALAARTASFLPR